MVRQDAGSVSHRCLATSVLLGMILVLVLVAPAGAQVIKLQAGCTHPTGVIADAADKFIELVKQKTNGQIIITNMYQALGVEQQLTQAVMAGSVDIGTISGGNSSRFTDALLVTDLPFLFKKYDNLFKVLDGPIGDKIIARYEKDLGVKYLFAMHNASARDIHTRNKQLKVPADIKGMKIRTTSTPVEMETFKAWGANPTPVDWSQCYTALQQGVVDGFQPELQMFLAGKFYEVAKYTIRLDFQTVFLNFFMNRKKFDSLSPGHQKAVMEAAREAHVWNMKEGATRIQAIEKELIETHGHNIYKPSPEEYAQWASVRESVWKNVGEKMKGRIDMNLANEIYRAQ